MGRTPNRSPSGVLRVSHATEKRFTVLKIKKLKLFFCLKFVGELFLFLNFKFEICSSTETKIKLHPNIVNRYFFRFNISQ